MELNQSCDRQIYYENLRTNNLMVSIIICFSLINGAIGIDGVSYITIASVFLLFVYGVLKRKKRFYVESIGIPLYVIMIFIISFFAVNDNEYTMYYFKYFLGFCLLSFWVGMQDISINNVLKYVERIGLVCVVVFILRGFDGYDVSIQMGIMYSMLPVLYAAVINVIEKIYNRTISLINIVLILWCYINVAPRGIWLNVAITIVLYVFLNLGKKENAGYKFIFRMLAMVAIIVGLLILYRYFGDILMWISNSIYKLTNVKVYALDKAAYLFNTGNLSNGRTELTDLAKYLLRGNWFLGRGIGYFEIVQGTGGYVHSLVYQALCEAGVFFFIPVVCIAFVCIKYLLRSDVYHDSLQFCFFLLLFSNGFVTLFYSSVYWKLLIFWLLLGYLIKLKKQRFYIKSEY